MAEADLYTIVKVARNEDLTEQIGRDRYFDLVDHNKVRSFRIKRWTPFNLFKEEVAKEFGIPVQFQRFWLWAKRKNHTYRPDRHVTPQQEAQPVGCLRAPKANDAELNLFLEVERSRRGLLKIPPPLFSDDILLFFKLYDPLKEELRYVGQFYVKADRMPVDILAKINRLAGFAPGEDIELFEEIKSEPHVVCERVDKMVTFRHSELGNGDIICFQISPADESSGQCGHPNVPSFLEYVHDHQAAEHVPSEPTHFVNASNRDSNYATPPAGKVRFLSYWVSSKASLLLGKIHCLHKETFVKFSVASRFMQTGVLESFALFFESMLTAKVNEVNEEVLRQAFLSVKEFEQVGLDLLWLKRRLEEAELVNKLSDSRIFVESCETILKCARAKVRELEEVLAKAKEEVELASRESPESLGVNDLVLKGVM